MARRTRRKIKRRQASRRRASRRLSQQRGGGGAAAAPPELPEITITVNPYAPYVVKSCMAKTETGKYVSIQPVDPDTKSPEAAEDPDWVAQADELLKKVVDETTLVGQSDGIFTYFVYKNKHIYLFDDKDPAANDIRLGCIKVRSGLEFGTSHMNLADYLGLYSPDLYGNEESKSATLLFAGEIKKEGRSVTYNFHSGTFIADHNISLHKSEPDTLKIIHGQRCDIMEALLAKYGLEAIFTDKSLFATNMPPFDEEERRDLESLGLRVKLFDDKDACDASLYGSDDEEDDED